MRHTRNVISALPLVADALGRKYGVKVFIGGERAFTDGRNIHLPSLPLDSDESVLNLARGYLDHEAAHLRTTDFDVVRSANLTFVEKHIWNIIEDYMVEEKLSALYPGCAQNFKWLIRRLFLGQIADNVEKESSPANHIFNWMLYSLRALAVPELSDERDRSARLIDASWPRLRLKLESIIQTIPQTCHDTVTCIQMARKIVAILERYVQAEKSRLQQQVNQRKSQSDQSNSEPQSNNVEEKDESVFQNSAASGDEDSQGKPEQECKNAGKHGKSQKHEQEEPEGCFPENEEMADNQQEAKADNSLRQLENALANPDALDTLEIGERTGKALDKMDNEKDQNKLTVATPANIQHKQYSAQELQEIRKGTGALRTRLNALLQAKEERRILPARAGRIDLCRIARLACLDTRIFTRHMHRQGINTAVHILLDASYSMEKGRIELACKASYALASALDNIPGVNVGVTAFPAPISVDDFINDVEIAHVSIVKRHGQNLHGRFQVECCGATPLAEAMWWLLQEMRPLKEQRKIVLILSDGYPDNTVMAQKAMEAHSLHGIEVYGIGIETNAMTRLLPEARSRAIYDLKEVVPAVFDLLRPALLG